MLGVAVYSRFSAKQAVAAATARQQPPAGADFDPSSPATFPAEAPGDGDGDEDVANSLRQHFMATGNFGTAVMVRDLMHTFTFTYSTLLSLALSFSVSISVMAESTFAKV